MKKHITNALFTLLLGGIFSFNCFAQAPPQAFSYQAVARDNNGNVIVNKTVSLRFTIHDTTATGIAVYQETQNPTTNTLGLVNLSIGTGTVVSGNFAAINWGSGPKFLQVEIDPTGGSSYTSLGTPSQLLSVPYALYAGNSSGGTTGQDVLEVDGTGSLTVNSGITSFAVIPGLTTSVNVPANTKLLVQTIGGFTNSGLGNAWIVVDIAIYVDGVNQGTPSYQRIFNENAATLTGVPAYWSIDRSFVLTPGPHTIDVEALFNTSSTGGSLNGNVSAAPGFIGHGELLITTIKQ